ncbi:MAG TPA: hypothetical protein VG125_06715, partial [Pirellulales bacterium]|nr:hypothetical protein [Pirellulales bacterium]
MLSKDRNVASPGTAVGCVIGLIVACQALRASAEPPAAGVLLDFQDDAQFAQIRVSEQTRIEPASEAYQGKRAAQIVFAAVPEGIRSYPAVVIEGQALRIRDFTPFEAIHLWVKNPGPDAAELSLSVWDKDGNRSFPIP